MSKNFPDNWVVLQIRVFNDEYIYKVLGGWSGGYPGGGSWQLNSGIVKVEESDYVGLSTGFQAVSMYAIKRLTD